MTPNPIDQFCDAIITAGLAAPESIEADGKLHRFSSNGKPGDDAGWYVFHFDGISAGIFGDWRIGLSETWKADFDRKLTTQEAAEQCSKFDALHLERRLMPMPFPWADDEWWAGPDAAKEALDLADAIGRGEVDMLEVNGNAMFFASDKVLEGLVGGS